MKKFLLAALAYGFFSLANVQAADNCKPSVQSEAETLENKTIALAITQNYNGYEKAVLYIPKSNEAVSIGRTPTPRSVRYDFDKIEEKARKYQRLTLTHLHGITVEDFVKSYITEQSELENINQLDKELLRKRIVLEIPRQDDINYMLLQEFLVHRVEPKVTVRHKVVSYSKGLNARVLEYSLSEPERKKYKQLLMKFDQAFKIAEKDPDDPKKYHAWKDTSAEISDFSNQRKKDFTELIWGFTMDKCKFYEALGCKEIDYKEFIDYVNAEGTFCITDHGTFDVDSGK